VVGSDLVYGAEKSRRCALLDTLQALAEAQEMLEAGAGAMLRPWLAPRKQNH
jgi:hypothetical protein